jgi:hypothetical protein
VDYRQRITIEPDRCGGKPCIRGLRITVYDVLESLASGMSVDEMDPALPLKGPRIFTTNGRDAGRPRISGSSGRSKG